MQLLVGYNSLLSNSCLFQKKCPQRDMFVFEIGHLYVMEQKRESMQCKLPLNNISKLKS